MHICVCVWWTRVPWCEGDTHVGSEDSFMESFLSFHLYIGSIQVSLLTFFFFPHAISLAFLFFHVF